MPEQHATQQHKTGESTINNGNTKKAPIETSTVIVGTIKKPKQMSFGSVKYFYLFLNFVKNIPNNNSHGKQQQHSVMKPPIKNGKVATLYTNRPIKAVTPMLKPSATSIAFVESPLRDLWIRYAVRTGIMSGKRQVRGNAVPRPTPTKKMSPVMIVSSTGNMQNM